MNKEKQTMNKEKQKQRVQEIIQKNYKNSTQLLDLYDCENIWNQVIMYRNWVLIKELGLTNCRIKQKIHIITQRPWPNLILLTLSDNKIGCKGIKQLVKAEFPQLQDLWLFSCDIGNEGLKNLTKSKWPKMKMLHLSDNWIGIDGYLSSSSHNWKEIQQIRLTHNQNDPIVLFSFVDQPSKHLEKLLITIKNNEIDSDLRPVLESILKK